MSGQVMPSFPHTLIGLGPFADQGCTIVFTATTVTVYYSDGHPVLAGWREQTGPRLWHFPLTKQGATPPAAASITTLLETIPSPPPRAQPPSVGTLRPLPAQSLTLPPAPQHPSQEILATSSAGVVCAVYYIYGAAQAVALGSRATRTAFDPQSLDLPSIGALVGFYHACLGFPVKKTWLDAIKAGNCDTFKGLTYSNAAKYCPDSDERIMVHLAQQCQNVRSTKPKQPTPVPLVLPPPPLVLPPPPLDAPSRLLFVTTQPLSKLYTNDTGRFPIKSQFGNQYVMIAFHADGNLILQQAFKTKSNHH
jgi:hypothetical protein